MYRTALRSAPSALRAARPTLSSGSRRFASTTAQTSKKGTWKGTGFRWGLAVAAVYFYNTSPIFADELPPQVGPAPAHFSDADLPTIEAMIEEKRRQGSRRPPRHHPHPKPTQPVEAKARRSEVGDDPGKEGPSNGEKGGMRRKYRVRRRLRNPARPRRWSKRLRNRAPSTRRQGEINWGCPCLGGMADGPCGEEFKAAFSCFVYSKDEPKGMDCVDKFPDCFRKYPEIYGSELTEDDEEENAQAQEVAKEIKTNEETATPPQKAADVSPKEAADATDANKGKKQ